MSGVLECLSGVIKPTALGLTLIAIIGAITYARFVAPPPHAAVVDCLVPPAALSPLAPWRFQPDGADAGLDAAWFAPDFDDSNWDVSAPGVPWEENGYLDLDGVAWYRATFDIPAAWETATLGTVGVDDSARLWINGTETALEALVRLPTGGHVQITYRVEDLGGFGGIKRAAAVGAGPLAVLPGDDYVRWLAAQHPQWPLPAWVNGDYHAWTFTGAPGTRDEAIISADAAVVPWAAAPLVELWLREADGRLSTPEITFSLVDETLPLPQAAGSLGSLALETRFFARFDGAGTYWQTTLRNETDTVQPATLYAVVRPLAVEAALRPITGAGFNGQDRLWINGDLFAKSWPRPQQTTVGLWQAVMEEIVAGRLDSTTNLNCAPLGDGMALLAYDLKLPPGEKWDLTLSFPTQPGGRAPNPRTATTALNAARNGWKAEIGEIDVTIPDDLVMNAYKASIGTLLLALDPDGPHPGPLAHDALWVRDAAFIGETLISLGRADVVADYIPSLFAFQRDDGYVPAIIEPGRGPRPDVEWDAQGQLMFIIAEYWRATGDQVRVTAWYPHVRAAGEFLVALRQQTATDPPETRGILPPSKSAEDLGSAEWHHYWDNFWAIAGLESGAYLAAELGHPADARWMQAEADALRAALRNSIIAVMGPEPAYIPNGPEDTTSSAMARGSANSLYPVAVFDRDDPLIIRSFDVYYERWIAPQQGGYTHIFGQWWPYGGLGLARDYVRLGRHDILHQILGWTLTHQTLPGTFAWAEQVSPATGGFTGGDMPHAWAASSYVTLIGEMLLLRDGEALELFAGVPGSWLEAGKVVGLTAAPTPFGPLTAVTESTLAISEDSWTGMLVVSIAGAQPPGGFRWRLPRLPDQVDGPPGTRLDGEWLLIPAAGGMVSLHYGNP